MNLTSLLKTEHVIVSFDESDRLNEIGEIPTFGTQRVDGTNLHHVSVAL